MTFDTIITVVGGSMIAASATAFAVIEPDRALIFCRVFAAVVTGLVHLVI